MDIIIAAEFTFKSSITEDLGVSLLELDLSSTLKTPSGSIPGTEIPIQSSKEFKTKLNSSLQDVKLLYRRAKPRKTFDNYKRLK